MLKDKRVIGFASLAIGVIVILNFAFFSKAGAGFWTEITMLPSDQQWYSFTSFTSSADGTKLIAGSTGNVFTSSDSGATWNEQVGSGPRVWKQIISSADGNTLFAIQFSFSPTYMLKSVDGGATWTDVIDAGLFNNGLTEWGQITMSADGTKVAARRFSGPGVVYTSSDGGTTWNERNGLTFNPVGSIAYSPDGSKLVFTTYSGFGNHRLYISTDDGLTETDVSAALAAPIFWNYHYGIAMSYDGSIIYVAGGRFVSQDGGTTWTDRGSGVGGLYLGSSYDGLVLLAINGSDTPFSGSSDGGETWVEYSPFDQDAVAGAITSNGLKLYVTLTTGQIYVADTNASIPVITMTSPSEGQTIPSWNPNINWGASGACSYSYDNITFTPTSCFTNTVPLDPNVSASTSYIYLRGENHSGVTNLVRTYVFELPVTWTTQVAAGDQEWIGVAASTDGTKVVAVNSSGDVSLSSDGGTSWAGFTDQSIHIWRDIAVSGDGTKVIASVNGGYLYGSSDNGATLTEQTSAGTGSRVVAMSSNGTKMAAVEKGRHVYTSVDSGATWTEQTASGQRSWRDVAISADGLKIVAVEANASIHTSEDGGNTWTEQVAAGSRNWSGVASSDDGSFIVAVPEGDYIYTSSDSGATWTEQTASDQRDWSSVDTSSDGLKVVATDYNYGSGGYIYTSEDGGATWTEQTTLGAQLWSAVASSSDGETLAVVYLSSGSGGKVYLSADGGATWEEHLSGSSWTDVTVSDDGRIFFLTDDSSCDGSCE